MRHAPLALLLALPALALATAGCATAQSAPAAAPMTAAPAPADTALTDAERTVQALLREEGVHVVHFWAPWCDNSIGELREGWYEVIENNPDVDFTFVTVWSDGATGQEELTRYAIPERVRVLTQTDFGPSADKPNRRKTFLGMPVTWIPTTWVFRPTGELAYAFNYGELTMPQLQQALDGAVRSW